MSTGRKIVFILALMVFVGSLGYLVNHYLQGKREQNDLEALKEYATEKGKNLVTDKGVVLGKYVKLYKQNPDMIGWIKVEDTHIDYPVMQTKEEPEFYLRRNFEKEDKVSGVPFMDAQSDIFKPTSNFLLYGHNMNNGTMFHDLLEYAEEEFYQKHKTFQFDTIYKGGQGTYEVIAAFHSQIYPQNEDNVFKYYNYAGLTGEKDFNTYIEGIKRLSEYETDATAEYGDQLVTMSTCSYHVPDKLGRFAVVAKRIK